MNVLERWGRQWHPTPVLLPWKSHGQRSLVGCSSWVTRSRTRLSNFTFTFHFHALEKEMATHPSVLAWRIPGTGEPGGLPSMGSHRVGHDWSNLAAAAANLWWEQNSEHRLFAVSKADTLENMQLLTRMFPLTFCMIRQKNRSDCDVHQQRND